ncbi:hypothetical protein RchiOBHm_Chr6g0271321 [Rosa chinensis]|uniref:Pentatricopeptide n=1 Tax=Rosa chinensis TaxID=74649 RepID=A0A2P6PQX0_ROSCH|nr:hypothetical protein RchiOBHm_Chr6g0271321 [Rosa chinensis]
MISEGMVPTHFALAILFSACGGWLDVEKGRKCYSLVEQTGLEVNLYVGNTLLCMYAKCEVIKDTMQVFGKMAKPNEITVTARMGGLKQMDKIAEALEMFWLMCRTGVCVDSTPLFVDIEKDPSFVALSLLKASNKCKLVQQLWVAATQPLGLLVEIKVMKKGFHKHINSVLQVTESILQSAIGVVTHDSPHEIAIPFWNEGSQEYMGSIFCLSL